MAEFQQQKLSDRVHGNSWIAKLKSFHLEINSVGRMGPFSTSQSTERSYARKERMERVEANASFPSKGGREEEGEAGREKDSTYV